MAGAGLGSQLLGWKQPLLYKETWGEVGESLWGSRCGKVRGVGGMVGRKERRCLFRHTQGEGAQLSQES